MAKLKFTPTNEMQTREWFVRHLDDYGYDILISQAAYPDYILCDGTGKQYKVEAEFESSNFLIHKHDPEKCDFVLCWLHNDKLPIAVLEISTGIFYRAGEVNQTIFEQNINQMNKYYAQKKRFAQALRKDVRTDFDHFIDCYTKALRAREQYLDSITDVQLELLAATETLIVSLIAIGLPIEPMHPDDLFSFLTSSM